MAVTKEIALRQQSKTGAVKIVPAPSIEPLGAEIIERAIMELAAGMKALNKTRLRRATIVTLIHANSRVGKREIELVLNNLDDLENTWLKPKSIASAK